MAAPSLDEDEEKPLDPALEQVRQKLRRLILVAGLTLGLGIVAVFLAIIYRLATDRGEATTAPEAEMAAARVAEAVVPRGSRLVSVASAGSRIVLVYDHGDGSTLIVVDPSTLTVAGRLELKPQ